MGTLINRGIPLVLRRSIYGLLFGLFATFALASCEALPNQLSITQLTNSPSLKDPEVSQEHRGEIVATVSREQSVGQSLISRRSGLNGFELWMGLGEDADPSTGILIVELYHHPDDNLPIITIPISYQTIANNSSLWISIPPQKDPPNQEYFLQMRTQDGSIHIMGRQEDAYAYGNLYLNQVPQPSDLSFRTSYLYDFHAVAIDIRSMFEQIWLVIPFFLVLWLPGALVLEWLIPRSSDDWGVFTGLAIGLSLALIPLVMLWTSLIGLRWNRLFVILLCAVLLMIYIRQVWRHWQPKRKIHIDKINLALLAIFLISLGTRLAMTRDLAAPAWVDSVHHGTLTRLILDLGIVPESYEPYVDLQHANYHFGFHSALAVFLWLSGLEIHTGMLVFGQVLNALSIFSAYLLTVTFTRNRIAGVAAALLTGVFSPMPAYYASWGRYTQLAGQLILPAAAWLAYRLWRSGTGIDISNESVQRRFRSILIFVAGAACGGILLVHYRVAAFLGVLLIADWISVNAKALWKHDIKSTFGRSTISLLAIGGLAVLFTLPWWPATISGLLVPFSNIVGSAQTPPPFFSGFSWNLLTAAFGRQVIVLAGVGLALAVVLRRWFWLTIVLWVGGMFLLSNMPALGLPAFNFINNLSVEIGLYLPLTLLSGFVVGWSLQGIASILPIRIKKPYWIIATIASAILALYGARALLPILNPITFLFRSADMPAISWIAKNIPEDETILINPFLWGYGLYAGQDGGYWITPLGRRVTMPPPMFYGIANETDSFQNILDTTNQILEVNSDPQALHALLGSQSIHYVFLGARGGVLSAKMLEQSPLFKVLYHQDGAWVFEVEPTP